ncbi:hypothetical protein SAMN05660350_00451 [Geodermatophilus obscurus]|uniref:Uncharacterized protein n=1 Tax=Geodermatophilus obscurus TaxID=1861 RepID=A0A1M7S3J7_9ACTN|nr:hypothetical protein [Geodermatophilus obscurus]SHN53026.1 hypothetical protein SAMN05660350_00451 [Geodermatophilus obscurus]
MTGFSRSPRLVKGALVTADPLRPLSNLVIFQYNPDTVTRTVTARAAEEDGDTEEALRLAGPPRETIRMTVEVDATDQLETGDRVTQGLGLHPALARLELLLWPSAGLQIANAALLRAGVIEIVPPIAPLTLLVWGPVRVLPVRLTSFTITEESFDQLLNPTQASIDLNLDVLTYQDLGLNTPGGSISMAHHVAKEVMSEHLGGSLSPLVGSPTVAALRAAGVDLPVG